MSSLKEPLNKNPRMNLRSLFSQRLFLFLAAGGLALRILLVLLRPSLLGADEVIYDPLGWGLASSGRYILDGTPATWPPGYPAFLALIYSIFGHSTVAAGIVQSLLDILTGAILAALGTRRFGMRTGEVIFALWMFVPMRALLPSLLISEASFLLFFVAALAIFSVRGWGAAILNGLLWTAILYTRPVAAAAVLVLAVGRWYYEKWRALVPVCMTALLLLPYALWNLHTHGTFTIYTGAGINFYMGHNAQSNGGYGFPQGQLPWDTLSAPREMAVNKIALQAGVRDMLTHPWREPMLLLRKTALFFMSDVPIMLVYSPQPEDSEMSLRRQIASRPILARLLVALPYMLIVLLAWTGFFFLKSWEGQWVWWASAATFFLLSLVFVAVPRYHEPLMPLLVLQAGAMLALPKSEKRKPSVLASRIWLLGSLGFISIWIAEWAVVLTA
jgi:hypothetical protein